MQIRRIKLSNLHSIRELVEVDFTKSPLSESGLFAITGDTGAGKSTILDAITLAIYGKICRQSDEKEALSHGASEGFAECEYEAKGRRFLSQWRVKQTKSKKPGQHLKTDRSVAEWDDKTKEFHVVAERKIREVNEFVEDVTGLDFARFTRSVMLAQGDFAAFLKANEKERSDLLERITGTEIYSELSMAALERKNQEKSKLDTLAEKRESLRILSTEEVKDKKQSLKANKEEHKNLSEKLESAKSVLQKITKVEKLKKDQILFQDEAEKIELKLKDMEPLLQQLQLHQKAMPLYPTLARYEDKQEESQQARQLINRLTGEIGIAEKEVQINQAKYSEYKTALEEKKKGQPKAFKLFDEIAAMDVKINGLNEVYLKYKNEYGELSDEWGKNKEAVNNLEKNITNQKSELSLLHQWLSENKVLENLTKDLPTISHIRSELNKVYFLQEASNEAKKESEEKLKGAKSVKSDIEHKLNKETALFNQINNEFKEITPAEFTTERSELLQKLNIEIDSLSTSQNKLAQLEVLNVNYQSIISDINQYSVELRNLRNEELVLDKEFLTVIELCEEAEKALEFKKEIYRQQQSLVNYEKDRAELKDGEPCPLCLSTDHPFRQQDFKPFIDLAKTELNTAEQYLKEKQNERNNLVKKHLEIASRIQQLDHESTGQLTKLKKQLSDLENKLSIVFPEFAPEDFSNSNGNWLSNKLNSFESALKTKKETREKLNQLHNQLSSQESKIKILELQLKDVQMEELDAQKSLQHAIKSAGDQTEHFENQVSKLNKLISIYGHSFSREKAKSMFEDLVEKEKDYTSKSAHSNQLDKQYALDVQTHLQMSQSAELLEEKLKKSAANLKAEKDKLDAFITERKNLFGSKNPSDEKDRFNAELQKIEEVTENYKTALNELTKSLSLKEQAIKSEKSRLELSEKEKNKLSIKLESELAKIGLPNIEALKNAVLSEEKSTAIQSDIEQLKKADIESKQKLSTIELELAEAQKSLDSTETKEELIAQIASTEKTANEILRQIGAIQQQLKDNDDRKKEAKDLLMQADEQRSIYNRWLALYDLIGSSDGKKFRVFAQGLTLQKLVNLANTHLENLFGRYFITKRKGEDLELDIVDTYQADNVRSMHTLSGGESFLVSLSLALGLSDLAGKNANIKSLFIDEGFGTLDDQTLDLALVTLENLQARGKTIGIISHVKELKERISTQVQVIKKGGGNSTVEIIG